MATKQNYTIDSGIDISTSNTSVAGISSSASDGSGLSTLELRPDTSVSNDQYIIVDPGTSPNTIRLRAGGNINDSAATFALGGTATGISISDSNEEIILNANNKSYSFDSAGNVTLPDGGAVNFERTAITQDTAFGPFTITSDTGITLNSDGSNAWTFGINGNLTLPGNSSSINYANGSPYVALSNPGSKIVNGTSNVEIAVTDGSVTSSVSGTVITTVSGSGLAVSGNVSGNVITANTINATASNVSNLAAGSGNITTLIATTANVSGNVSFNSKVVLNSVANVVINGGANGQFLQTDGQGNLSWATPVVAPTFINNGSSNVAVTANGNVSVDIGGTANVAIFSSDGLTVAGNISANNLTVPGNLTVTGNLNYNQTQQLQIEDPIIEQGGGPNGAPLTTNDGFDRGALLRYFDSGSNSEKAAFVGWRNSTGEMIAAKDVTIANNIISVTSWGNLLAGNVVANLIATDANVSGNITVGGVSDLGNIASIRISGGNSGEVLSTDGSGNLSWIAGGGPSVPDPTGIQAGFAVITGGSNDYTLGYPSSISDGVFGGSLLTASNVGMNFSIGGSPRLTIGGLAQFYTSVSVSGDISTSGDVSAARGFFSGNMELSSSANLLVWNANRLYIGGATANNQVLTSNFSGAARWANVQLSGDSNSAAYYSFSDFVVTQNGNNVLYINNSAQRTTIAQNLTVTGSSSANSIFSNGVQANTTLTVLGTFTANATGNIRNLNVLGNATITGNAVFNGLANVDTANLRFVSNSGSNGQVLTSNGGGGVSWTTISTGTSSNIANGTSNVSIDGSGGNIVFTANGIQHGIIRRYNTDLLGGQIALGWNTQSNNSAGAHTVAIGTSAGRTSQGFRGIAIGYEAANTSQSEDAIAIGTTAASNSQGNNSIAIGFAAGRFSQGSNAIAIGWYAGSAFGDPNAGPQGQSSIAIGASAATNGSGQGGIAIGFQAASSVNSKSSTNYVAIGNNIREIGNSTVAIGPSVNGGNSQNSILIGAITSVGQNPANNVIILNASGSGTTGATANAFYVNPIRNITSSNSNSANVLVYNTNTREITSTQNNLLVNGNSNITIVANANVNISAIGNANVVTIGNAGATITGTTTVTWLVATQSANVPIVNATTVNATTVTATGNITAGNLIGAHANGNTDINIPTANGNILFDVSGTSNVAVFTPTGMIGRIRPRVTTVAAVSGTLNIDTDSVDQYNITAANAAWTMGIPTGTFYDGQQLMLRWNDNGSARAITWTTGVANSWRSAGATLPTTTTANRVTYVSAVYNTFATRWDVYRVSTQA